MGTKTDSQDRMWELGELESDAVAGGLLAGDILLLVEKAKWWIREKLAWRI